MSAILLIGYGAIGQYVLAAMRQCPHSQVVAVLCREGRQAQVRQFAGQQMACVTDPTGIADRFDLVVECAGHSAMSQHVPVLLQMGKAVISVSNGALADSELEKRLREAALAGGAQLSLLSGAIGALDALSAAGVGGLDSVTYRGCKPPVGWQGSLAEQHLDLATLQEATVFFRGTAREAALKFPKNANVAASVALASMGLDTTMVELVADPALSANRHEVEAVGQFGRLQFSIEGRALPDNPRSSALTAMSIVREIERRNSSVRIG